MGDLFAQAANAQIAALQAELGDGSGVAPGISSGRNTTRSSLFLYNHLQVKTFATQAYSMNLLLPVNLQQAFLDNTLPMWNFAPRNPKTASLQRHQLPRPHLPQG
jgi:hypothetical protein